MSTLDEIIELFAEAEPPERIELLLDFARRLPPLPEHLEARRQAGAGRVHECMTPVFVFVEPAQEDGRIRLYVGVAPEAPTIAGFAGILVRALDGATRAEVEAIPDDLIARLGLDHVIRMNRVLGIGAFITRIKRQAAEVG